MPATLSLLRIKNLALVDDLTLVSNEALFDSYGVKRLW